MKNNILLLIGLLCISINSFSQNNFTINTVNNANYNYGGNVLSSTNIILTDCSVKATGSITFSGDVTLIDTKIECTKLDFNGANITLKNSIIICKGKTTFGNSIGTITITDVDNIIDCDDTVFVGSSTLNIKKGSPTANDAKLLIKYKRNLVNNRIINVDASVTQNIDVQIIKSM